MDSKFPGEVFHFETNRDAPSMEYLPIFHTWSIWERFWTIMAVASLQFPALAQVGNFRRVRKIGNAIYGEAKAG